MLNLLKIKNIEKKDNKKVVCLTISKNTLRNKMSKKK